MNHHVVRPEKDSAVDPVCGMAVEMANASARRLLDGHEYFFCSTYCAEVFDANPEKYAKN